MLGRELNSGGEERAEGQSWSRWGNWEVTRLPHLSVAEAHATQFSGYLQTKGPQLLEALHSGLLYLLQHVILGRIVHLLGKAQDPTSRLLFSITFLSLHQGPSPLFPSSSHYLEETGHRPHQLLEKLCLLLIEYCRGGEEERQEGQEGQAGETGQTPPSYDYLFPYQTGMGTPDRW